MIARALALGARSTGLGNMLRERRVGFHVAEWGVFCHTARLRNRTTRLKLNLFDSTPGDGQIQSINTSQLHGIQKVS